MNLNSKTTVFGLFGFPVKHSLSPQIHNYIFNKSDINAAYLCFEVSPQNLKDAVRGVFSLGLKGINITIPHKENIIKYLDKADKEAQIIGAVNTVKIEKNKLQGFNTDGEGFVLSLKKYRFEPRSKNILILGAGGAAKSIGVYLAKEKVESLAFYDIFRDKANSLAENIKKHFNRVRIETIKDKHEMNLKNVDLLVNATGVGLDEKDKPIIELTNFNKSLIVYDLIYNPLEPVLIREAKKARLSTMNGLWMLIYQAIRAENIWWNKDFSSLAEEIYDFLLKGQM